MAEVLATYVLGTDTISTIEAGVQNENDASCVKFDYSDWKEEYGDGILSMRIQRREDDDPYPVLLTVSTDPDDGENVMVWSISDVDTAQIGKHKAQLTYTVDGVRKKTTVFLYRIVRSVVSGDTVPDPYDDWLEDLESMASDMLDDGAAIVNEAKGYRNEASGYATAASGSATSASNSASDSEAYAKGTRGGTAIDSDDPAYHKNSKYYSEQAATSASNASDSASTANTAKESASGFATNSAGHSQNSEAWAKGTRGGTAVGSDDPAYHNNSKYFSEQASASATAAAGSATTASDSATAAAGSATTASDSAIAAAGSATAAAASVSSLAPAYSSSATYDVGDYVLYSGSLYRCTTEITTAEEWTASHWTSAKMSEDVSDLKSDFDNKADIDGSYPELSAGNITGDYHLDTEPYLFRTTGGSADVGNREYLDKIVGGTVGWNQLCNGSSVTVQSGRKYLLKKGTAWSIGASTGTAITGLTSGSDMLIDLTALFNPTIADYIYSLEQSSAGAGVAWFRNYFPKGYYPYDPGTLRSVEGVSAHETVGFNQWDEELETGQYSPTDGKTGVSGNAIRAKNYIPVLENTEYYVYMTSTTSGRSFFYDADYNLVSTNGAFNRGIFTVPSGARYMKFHTSTNYGKTYNNDICINISDPSRNGEYEPYQKHTYPLDSSLRLGGTPKLVDGKLAFDGDVYPPSGEVQRRYSVVDLGTLDWGYSLQYTRFSATVNDKKPYVSAEDYANLICSAYPFNGVAGLGGNMVDKTIVNRASATDNQIVIKDTAYTDAASFKAAMSGVYMVYEKATPTTETADGYDHYQICDQSGTEAFVTTGIVPVGHETAYELNLVQKLINLPWDMSMIAPVEDGATASQAYAQGKYFLRNNEFCKAKTAIASGATFTLNTNYEVTTVAAELFAALS